MAREEEDRKLRLREALERRRRKEQYEFEQATNPTQPQAYGLATQRGPGNWVQPTRDYVPARFDDEGNILSGASWKPGADMPAGDPYAMNPKDAALADYRERKLRQDAQYQRDRVAAMRERKASGDGLTTFQRLSIEERRKNRERLERNSGKGGTTEKGWREGLDQTLTSIQSAEPGKLKSIIRQYGGDAMMTDNMDDEMLREAAYSVAETYWNKRKPGSKADDSAQSDERGSGAKKAPQDVLAQARAAIATKGRAAVVARLAELGYSDEGL